MSPTRFCYSALLPTGWGSETGAPRACWVLTSQSAPATLRKGESGDHSSEMKEMSPDGANPTALAPCCNISWRSHQAEYRKWQVNQMNWCSSYAPDCYSPGTVKANNKKIPNEPPHQATFKRKQILWIKSSSPTPTHMYENRLGLPVSLYLFGRISHFLNFCAPNIHADAPNIHLT